MEPTITTEEKLLQNFELFYKEWKEMDTFFTKNEDQKLAGMGEMITNLLSSETENPQAVVEFVIETRGLPALYAQQLERNKEELLAVYNLIENVVEIPAEIKKDVENLREKKTKIIFKIEKGEPVTVDEQFVNEYLARLKSPQFLQQTLTTVKNITELGNIKKE